MLPLDFPHRLGWTESNDGFEADCNFIAALGGLLLLVGGLLFWGGA